MQPSNHHHLDSMSLLASCPTSKQAGGHSSSMAYNSQRTMSRLLISLPTPYNRNGNGLKRISSSSSLSHHQQHQHQQQQRRQLHQSSPFTSSAADTVQPSHADPHANVAQNQSPSPIGKHAEAVSMKWEDYFRLRKSRKTWGTVAAVPTSLAGVMIGGGGSIRQRYAEFVLNSDGRLLCEPGTRDGRPALRL